MATIWQQVHELSSIFSRSEEQCSACCDEVTPPQESSGFLLWLGLYIGSAALFICGNQLLNRFAGQRRRDNNEVAQPPQPPLEEQQQQLAVLTALAALPAKQWALATALFLGESLPLRHKWQRICEKRHQIKRHQRTLRRRQRQYRNLPDDDESQLVWQDVVELEDGATIIQGELYLELSDDEDVAPPTKGNSKL